MCASGRSKSKECLAGGIRSLIYGFEHENGILVVMLC